MNFSKNNVSLIIALPVLALLIAAPTYFGKAKTGVYDSTLRGVSYTIYVPENLDPSKKYHLVIALHSHEEGMTAKDYIKLWENEAKKRNIIVVCPESKAIQEDQHFPIKDWLVDGVHHPNDYERLANFIPSLILKYNIDQKNIFIVGSGTFFPKIGLNNSGTFALGFGVNNPDIFKAVCMINGYTLKQKYPDNSVKNRQLSTDSYTWNNPGADNFLEYSNKKESQIPILFVNQKNNQYITEEDVRMSTDKFKGFGYDASYQMVDNTGKETIPLVLDWFESKVEKSK